jgi:hypothetical protein
LRTKILVALRLSVRHVPGSSSLPLVTDRPGPFALKRATIKASERCNGRAYAPTTPTRGLLALAYSFFGMRPAR